MICDSFLLRILFFNKKETNYQNMYDFVRKCVMRLKVGNDFSYIYYTTEYCLHLGCNFNFMLLNLSIQNQAFII